MTATDKLIVGIVYENGSEALSDATRDACDQFRQAGYYAATIDYRLPAHVEKFVRLAQQGRILFGFGYQGVGAQLPGPDNGNLWRYLKTPFISLHHDHPCHNPYNHFADSPYIANLYRFESFLAAQKRYVPQTGQLSAYAPITYGRHVPAPSPVPFRDRQIQFVFVKSGERLEPLHEEIAGQPPQLRDGLMAIVETCRRNPNLELCDLVADLYRTLGADWSQFQQQFWADVKWVDTYIRRERAIALVEALKNDPETVIVGNGWDFVDKEGARAVFKPALSSSLCSRLYDETRFLCNSNPYGRDIVHERVMTGLARGCCILTDGNTWWDKHFADCPALTRFRWDQPLADQINQVLVNPAQAEAASATGREAALRQFASDLHQPVHDLVAQVRRVVGS